MSKIAFKKQRLKTNILNSWVHGLYVLIHGYYYNHYDQYVEFCALHQPVTGHMSYEYMML
jgi:hypothetical protein